MVLSGFVFWNGMFILWTFKNIDSISISSDYKGAAVRIEGRSIFMYCTVVDNFETVMAEKGV